MVTEVPLQLRQDDSLLILVLAPSVRITDLADLIGLEKQDLTQSFVCIDFRGQRGGV